MTSEINETVGSFYEGTPVSIGTIATALGLSIGDLITRVREEERAGVARYSIVTRSINPATGRLQRGPASMAFLPDWAL